VLLRLPVNRQWQFKEWTALDLVLGWLVDAVLDDPAGLLQEFRVVVDLHAVLLKHERHRDHRNSVLFAHLTLLLWAELPHIALPLRHYAAGPSGTKLQLGSRSDSKKTLKAYARAAVCDLGLEGIVSKKLTAPYRSGPSKTWIKVKNPKAPAATRVLEGDF